MRPQASAELDNVLGDVFFLRNEPPQTRRELAALAMIRSYPRGNILYYHGDPGEVLYIVVDGRVKVMLMNEEGREVTLAVTRPGGVLGLVAALDEGPQIGTAITLTDCCLARLSRAAFDSWLMAHPSVHVSLTTELARTIRDAYLKIGEQALLPVKQRLLSALLEVARADGMAGQGGTVTFRRPTHQELADLVGSSRVVVSRLLKELLAEEDAIQARGKVIRITIKDLVPPDAF